MKRRTFLKLGGGAAVGSALAACGAGHEAEQPAPQYKTVLGWNEVALQAIRDARPGPPMAARSLAIVHTCMYDAWAAYDAVAIPTAHGAVARRPVAERTAANRHEAMSYAACLALADQFPSRLASFEGYLRSLGFDPAGTSPAASVGHAVAAAMLDYCHKDGSNQLGNLAPGGTAYVDYTGYVPANPPMNVALATPPGAIPAPDHWQPLTYADAAGSLKTPGYLAACWGRVTPFALASASQFRPGPPALAGTPEYAAQARRLVDVQLAMTERDKIIAEYWADGPSSELPPGHWCMLAHFISARDGHGDDEDVKMYFALANALSDAAIAAWDAKRAYDSARPITAIRYLLAGTTIMGYGPRGPAEGLRPIQGEAWLPYQPMTFPTPPFPEHVSGHSTFSAAAGEVLKRFTGSDAFGASYTKRARTMSLEPSLPTADLTLSWPTFSDAVDEAGMSRIFGGIHFDNANTAGKDLGRKVGASVYDKARRLWLGLG